MARAYRTDTIDAIYEAIGASAALTTAFPQRRLLTDGKSQKIKAIAFRAPNDFPYLTIKTGDTDSGTIFGVQSFDDESEAGGDGVPRDVPRSATIYLDIAYNSNPQNATSDEDRDTIETNILAAIAGVGIHGIDGLVSPMTFTRRQRIAATLGTVTTETTRITLTANYLIDRSDTL